MNNHTVFKVIVPTEADADWFGRWLLAPNPAPTCFGRKRRARRVRGRQIEARRTMGHGHIDEVDRFLDPSPGEPWEGADRDDL